MIGLVYYSDDPHKRVFRTVYPEKSDAELDQPPTDGKRAVILKGDGTPHSWTSFAVDGARPVAMDKVPASPPPARKRGTPWTPASEPVVYFINASAFLSGLTLAQAATFNTWLAANPSWSNFIDLGSGTASTMAAPLISPAWLVVAGGQNPGKGISTRQTTIGATGLVLWVV